jgi:transposase InsO family protein
VLGVSEWFACCVTGQHRATQRHEPSSTTAEDPDAALRAWLRTYAEDHPRRGFRPAYHDARAEGWIVNHKKIHRLWREEGLRVPQRRRDNGPELACSAMADWAAGQVGLHFVPGSRGAAATSSRSTPASPTNASTSNSFWSLAHARVIISDWKRDYNHHRRHSALGYRPPSRYAVTCIHRCASECDPSDNR